MARKTTNPVILEAGYSEAPEAVLQVPVRYEQAYSEVTRRLPSQCGEGVEVVLSARLLHVTQESLHPPRFAAMLSHCDEGKSTAREIRATGSGVVDNGHPLVQAHPGSDILVSGLLMKTNGGGYRLLEAHFPPKDLPLVPVYPKKAKVKGEIARRGAYTAVATSIDVSVKTVKKAFPGWSEKEILEVGATLSRKKPFKNLASLIRQLHMPDSDEMAEIAREYATSLSVADILLQVKRSKNDAPVEGAQLRLEGPRIKAMLGALPFKPTNGQLNCMRKIYHGLVAPSPYRILLSGDVGTGKTCVFGTMAAAAAEAGHQVVIFSPNAPLADQTYAEIKAWFPGVGVELVTAKAKPPAEVFEGGKKPILVGTSALFRFCKERKIVPDCLVVDEQQKTSKQQRDALMAPHTNLIEATATCIPRTGALVMYGGMDLTVLNEYAVRKDIKSHLVREPDKSGMFRKLRETVKAGSKIAVILPLVRANGSLLEDPAEEEKFAVESALPIWEKLYPDQVVGLHGRMKEHEKLAALELVKSGQKSIVLATSLIEIGVNIRDLRALVVVEADRYGVSSLHQMRGRLARNGGAGDFFMYLSKSEVSAQALERLNFLCRTTDGFKLSEMDLNHRGFGDVADDSEQQAGQVVTLFANVRFFPPAVGKVGAAIAAIKGEEAGW